MKRKMSKALDVYPEFLRWMKRRIQKSRFLAYRAVNREQIRLYLNIGGEIAIRQARYGWGKSIVQRLAVDLRKETPNQEGFSAPNLWFMRQLYLEYKDHPNLLQLVREIPWGQNIAIMTKVKAVNARAYYLKATAELGWSRSVLIHQIEARAYQRHGLAKKDHNFQRALPHHLAEQADLALKDSYSLEFLGLGRAALEREVESGMIGRIRDVLLELGAGFAFLGSQVPLKLGQKTYFLDLLFYHRHLQCLIAIELKATDFQPEHAGKMNFYLNVLDQTIRRPPENPSIGIILCKVRDHLTVEYALRGVDKPMGVATYYLTRKLPQPFAKELPAPRELEQKVSKEIRKLP